MINWIKQSCDWLRRVFAWVAEPYLLWFTVSAILFVIALAWLVAGTWEARIRIAGLCLQLLGLVTVAWGLRKTRKLFSQPSLLQLAEYWLRRFPAFYRETRITPATGHVQAGSAVAGVGPVTSTQKASLEDRVAMLEENLKQTHVAINAIQKRIDEQSRKQTNALESERDDRKTEDEKNQKLLQEAMAGGLHLESIGVLWLFIGITLASASVEISRWLIDS